MAELFPTECIHCHQMRIEIEDLDRQIDLRFKAELDAQTWKNECERLRRIISKMKVDTDEKV